MVYRHVLGRWEVNDENYLTAKEARQHGKPVRVDGLSCHYKHPTTYPALSLWLERKQREQMRRYKRSD